jgi:predicted secreted protein
MSGAVKNSLLRGQDYNAVFAFWTMHFLKVNEKQTNSLTIQYIGIQQSPTCFGIPKIPSSGSQP